MAAAHQELGDDARLGVAADSRVRQLAQAQNAETVHAHHCEEVGVGKLVARDPMGGTRAFAAAIHFEILKTRLFSYLYCVQPLVFGSYRRRRST